MNGVGKRVPPVLSKCFSVSVSPVALGKPAGRYATDNISFLAGKTGYFLKNSGGLSSFKFSWLANGNSCPTLSFWKTELRQARLTSGMPRGRPILSTNHMCQQGNRWALMRRWRCQSFCQTAAQSSPESCAILTSRSSESCSIQPKSFNVPVCRFAGLPVAYNRWAVALQASFTPPPFQRLPSRHSAPSWVLKII